jgi:hypothetical protein
MIKIAFQTPQLDVRGSCDAIYNYAHYNEFILQNQSVILVPASAKNEEEGVDKFRKRFPIVYYNNLEIALDETGSNILYTIKYGKNDGIFSKRIPTIVHCVFDLSEPHGDVYIAVSKALAQKYGKIDYLPHIVNQKPSLSGDLRKELNIPHEAIVIGRHGGMDTFNLPWVHKMISKIVNERKDIYFLFINTPNFYTHKQIIYLPRTSDIAYKNMFISTCNAGLEASTLGHSFGLSCAEMSVNNKPMMVYNGPVWNNAHIKILGDKGLYFSNEDEFYKLVTTFKIKDRGDLNAYRDFSPEKVIKKFKELCILPFKK